ncbi:dihydrolipoyllysine-residue acetyltransferase [Wenzhouxiangella sp. XN24]|uniref:2-oxo acid dehydrogenase subunit E2 n=1 Tax=Wenzhouxiangella sp. XN24 TaxID=2713569 RepID=UPI0013EE1EBC|nr:dihydrolipoyllysine-residue acetyltransferase [Wenzhouxiangella sp. XN24]
MANKNEVRVPDIGDFEDVEIIEVHVQKGDAVAVEDPLITIETDKASMDVPSSAAGRVVELKVGKGDRVSAGDVVLLLESDGDGDGEKPEETAEKKPEQEAGKKSEKESEQKAEPKPADKSEAAPKKRESEGLPAAPPLPEGTPAHVHAGPSVRKFAREMGVDLGRVSGSGVKGRITHEDVKVWVKKALQKEDRPAAGAALPEVPEIDFTKFGHTELKGLSRVQRIAGPRLHASWVNLPHVTQFDEADITETERARKNLKADAEKEGAKLTPLAFIIRACVKALREFPQFNASLHPDGQQLIVKHYYNIGFAVDTPGGLVVPVIRGVEGKSLFQVARELGELSVKARDGKLSSADMQGGNFTISSLGSRGGTFFTPIINAPEVAILGVSRHAMQPVWSDGEFVPRLMLPLSLSYDHRVIDGAAAVRFTRYLAEILSDVDRLLA